MSVADVDVGLVDIITGIRIWFGWFVSLYAGSELSV